MSGAKGYISPTYGLIHDIGGVEDPFMDGEGQTSEGPTTPAYLVGAHFVLGHGPFDKITQIYINDILAMEGQWTGGEIHIIKDDLFGGMTREGGVSGYVDIDMGYPSQNVNTYLDDKIPGLVPAFRGVVSVILKNVYVGLNYYFKPWSFTVQRIHKRHRGIPQWSDSIAELGGASGLINAVHVIRECLTDPTWGLGHTDSKIDDVSFAAAAQRSYDEGMGFCFHWNNETTILDFINEVQKHIQASLYVDRRDGKFHLNLIRQIFDTSGLLALTTNNIIEVTDFKRKSIGDLVSSVSITYTDFYTHKNATYTVQNPSLMQRQGKIVAANQTYSGVATIGVASTLAARDAAQLSLPIFTCTIVCNREAEDLNPGDAFTLYYPDYLEATLIMRVISIDLGTPTSGKITIEASQDFFQASSYTYGVSLDSEWVSPVSDPVVPEFRLLNEMPYYMVAKGQGDEKAQAVLDTDSYACIAAVAPNSDSYGAIVFAAVDSGPYETKNFLDFCFTALTTTNITLTSTSVTVSDINSISLLSVGLFVQIDEELIQVTAYSANVLTIKRGVLDTIPATHTIGARIYGWNNKYASLGTTYLLGETVKIKLATQTARGTMDIAVAAEDTIAIEGRMHMPYPPGNVKLNSVAYPASITGALTITWSHRNRLSQTIDLIDTTIGDIGPEPGVTYRLKLYNSSNSLVRTISGITGTSYVWDTEVADSGLGTLNPSFRIELESMREDWLSFQKYNISCTRTGSLVASDSGLVAPTGLTSTGTNSGITWNWASVGAGTYSFEIAISTINDRDDPSVSIFNNGLGLSYTKTIPVGTFFIWVRAINGSKRSDWTPSSSTAGISGTPLDNLTSLLALITP